MVRFAVARKCVTFLSATVQDGKEVRLVCTELLPATMLSEALTFG